jgi:two-component system, OmpR family, sensor histidine kinase CpxA
MNFKNSLYSKILLWSIANVILVLGILLLFFSFQSESGLAQVFRATIPDNLKTAVRVISHDLSKAPLSSWSAVLEDHSKNFGIDFVVVLDNERYYSSTHLTIPGEVFKASSTLLDSVASNDKIRGDYPPGSKSQHDKYGRVKFNDHNPQHLESRLSLRTTQPLLYWSGEAIFVPIFFEHTKVFAVLFAVSPSKTGNGFFFDPFPWLAIAAAILTVSILLWIPLIKTITVPIKKITSIVEVVGHGKFDTHLNENSNDEIGRLAKKINIMIAQLSVFVDGQKNFLRDVSHEIQSPIARIQFGLAALGQRVGSDLKDRVENIIDDVNHMSTLVSELLAFARTENDVNKVELQVINLAEIVHNVLLYEAKENPSININISPDLSVEADPRLLARALGNIIRNANIYAKDAGPLRISAKAKEEIVAIEIADAGPGVPPNLIDQLFDPFFRIEKARSPGAGGTGLGLAITKTCITACNGTIFAKNATPSGLIITLHLKLAAARNYA